MVNQELTEEVLQHLSFLMDKMATLLAELEVEKANLSLELIQFNEALGFLHQLCLNFKVHYDWDCTSDVARQMMILLRVFMEESIWKEIEITEFNILYYKVLQSLNKFEEKFSKYLPPYDWYTSSDEDSDEESDETEEDVSVIQGSGIKWADILL